jgi:NADPH2:quinone reductase
MPKAIRINRTGGPEVLQWEEIDVSAPGPGEVRLRQTAIGLNYVDTYYRSGLYPLPMPAIIGSEGAGVVEAIGPDVADIKQGDRMAYAMVPGAYAEECIVPASRLVKIPDGISDQQAASMMLKGLTTQYLLRSVYRLKKGETVLFHAAAGGVGLIFGQWAKHLGAIVIGTAGDEEKAKLARGHGYDYVILYRETNFGDEVKKLTGGAGVPVVYDGVGKDTFTDSLDCLQPRGLMASFGSASGPVPPFNLGVLAQKGSLYVTRPTLGTFIAKREDLMAAAKELFEVVLSGAVKIAVNQTYALKDAAQAHADLEARKTTGSTILVP